MPASRAAVHALAFALLLAAAPAAAQVSPDRLAVLRRGVTLTHWFRFPPDRDPRALRAYMPDAAITLLRRTGFSFVRLAVQPEVITSASGALDPAGVAALLDAIHRLQAQGLAVVVDAQADFWHPGEDKQDRARLLDFWQALAPTLRGADPRRLFPEPLNEPVFRDPADWDSLQARLVAVLRRALPAATLILTGADWGSIDGLLRTRPVEDANVVYSFHFYEPAILTSLAAFQPGLDRAALAALPFPVTAAGCSDAAHATADARTGAVIRFYCAQHWDAARIAARLAQVGAWAHTHRQAVVMGEFGASASLAPQVRRAWLRAVREQAQDAGFGWALWGYDDTMGLGLDPLHGQTPDAALLAALGLAEPEAVPGTHTDGPRYAP